MQPLTHAYLVTNQLFANYTLSQTNYYKNHLTKVVQNDSFPLKFYPSQQSASRCNLTFAINFVNNEQLGEWFTPSISGGERCK